MPFDERASGVYVIAVTPFQPDGRIDTSSIDRVTDFYLECGVSGITALGVMGEAPKLDAGTSRSPSSGREGSDAQARFQVIVGVTVAGLLFRCVRLPRANRWKQGAAGAMMIAPPHHVFAPTTRSSRITGQAREATGDDVPSLLQDYPLCIQSSS